jgi:chemotaxis protein CheX
MNLQPLIISSINRSVLNVFSTMLGVELAGGEASVEQSTPDSNDGVVSFIGIAGTWAGTGSVCCSPKLACRVCELMLMTEAASVNEDVLDAVAELTNMVIGNVKTDLEAEVGPLGLSIPTVVFGRNFKTKSAGSTEWIITRFPWEGEILLVKVCLAPHEKSAHALHHMGSQVCALEV